MVGFQRGESFFFFYKYSKVSLLVRKYWELKTEKMGYLISPWHPHQHKPTEFKSSRSLYLIWQSTPRTPESSKPKLYQKTA